MKIISMSNYILKKCDGRSLNKWIEWERNGNAVFHFKCFDTYPLPPFPPVPTVTVDQRSVNEEIYPL